MLLFENLGEGEFLTYEEVEGVTVIPDGERCDASFAYPYYREGLIMALPTRHDFWWILA